MGLFTKEIPVVVTEIAPPTLDQQLDAADRIAKSALAVFQEAASRLETAADEADRIALESSILADEHSARAEAADDAASRHRQRAAKIRNLLD